MTTVPPAAVFIPPLRPLAFDAAKAKQRRTDAGLSREYVGCALGVTSAAVSSWERSVNVPGANRMLQLAALYGCDVSDLVS